MTEELKEELWDLREQNDRLVPVEQAARTVVDTWKSMPESVRSRMWVDFQAQLALLERAVDWTRGVG